MNTPNKLVYPRGSGCQVQQEAEDHLRWFSRHCTYPHGEKNAYLKWLLTQRSIARHAAVRFLCTWYSVSRHQPQILLLVAAAFHDSRDRAEVMRNYLEEDGLVRPGDEPHYCLLEQLIRKLGGALEINPYSESMAREFRESLGHMSAAYASGVLAGVEHVALDISSILHAIIRLAGFSDLLSSDIYLTIHVDVEPHHINDAHGRARVLMQNSPADREQVLAGFRKAMSYWDDFFPMAFEDLGYGQVRTITPHLIGSETETRLRIYPSVAE